MTPQKDTYRKSETLAQLIGLSFVESDDGSCLVCHGRDFISRIVRYEKGERGPFVDLYDSLNLHLAWRAAAFGLIYFADFRPWWEGLASHPSAPINSQGVWLDKLLELAGQVHLPPSKSRTVAGTRRVRRPGGESTPFKMAGFSL